MANGDIRDPNRRGVVRWKPKVAGRTFAPADVSERGAETDIYGAALGAMGGGISGERDKYIQENLGRFTDPFVQADLAYRTMTNQRSGAFSQPQGMGTMDMLSALLGMGRGGTSTGPSASDRLALRKYEDERNDLQRQREALAGYLSSGGYRAGSEGINQAIMDMAAQQRGDVEAATGRALENIAAGYGQAQDLTAQGFNALQSYLAQNPNDPYAQLVAASGVAPQAEGANILSAYGVGAEPVLAQVAAEAAASQQGAAGFQNLLNALSAAAQQADVSRGAEARMAGTVAGAGLESQRAGYRTQAEQAQAAALAQIAQRQAEAQLQERVRLAQLEEELRRQLVNAGVIPPSAPSQAPVASGQIPMAGQFGLVD
jgi:hypothetical protein